jgi:hypothetical protein
VLTLVAKWSSIVGGDPELVELRCDRLFQIYLRGFERCNGWNH